MPVPACADDELAELHRALQQQRLRPLRTILDRARARGEIGEIAAEHALLLIDGPFVARLLKSDEPMSLSELEPLVDLVAQGLRATVERATEGDATARPV
ncbi:MAG: TetR/AcrR family transcriptional regulator C-terminal ligand-binding domain-containing protein [Acidimicrobiales bacterium]